MGQVGPKTSLETRTAKEACGWGGGRCLLTCEHSPVEGSVRRVGERNERQMRSNGKRRGEDPAHPKIQARAACISETRAVEVLVI